MEDEGELDREMNEYEKELMAKFEQNDAEIDEVLDSIIEVAERLKFHA